MAVLNFRRFHFLLSRISWMMRRFGFRFTGRGPGVLAATAIAALVTAVLPITIWMAREADKWRR
jgi:hypothetical protein